MKLLRERTGAAPLGMFVVQFGKPFLPYLPLYLHSVGRNPLLDVVILTDQDVALAHLPPNAILYHIEEDELRARLRAFLRDAFAVDRDPLPRGQSMYKVCDYRPFFSTVFADALAGRGYTHVGWCDTDVVLGDLSSFLTDPDAYDVIGRMGHFTALRDTPFFRRLPHTVPEIRRHIATTGTMWHFDEVALWLHLERHYVSRGRVSLFSFYDQRFADVVPEPADRFELYHGVAALPDQHFRYEDGRLLRVGGGRAIDTVYAHFQKRPMAVRLPGEVRPGDPLRFVIRPNCFTHR